MKNRFRRRLLYTILLSLDDLFLLIPYRIALDIGRFVGLICYFLLGRYRRLTKEHLRFAFNGAKTEEEISKIAKSVFMNLGMGLSEVMSIPKLKNGLDDIIDTEGFSKVDDLLKEGKGIIAVTGHFGNWELLPMYFAYKGYSVSVIARPVYYEKYNEWIMFLRKRMGVNVIFRTDSSKKLISSLKRNEILGILPDQDIDSIEGVFVDFFGKKAYTPVAPVKIAAAVGAPILPIFIVRNDKRHTIIVDEPIRVDTGPDKERIVQEYTQRWSNIVESYIRKYPSQWVWMHKRWKTRLDWLSEGQHSVGGAHSITTEIKQQQCI